MRKKYICAVLIALLFTATVSAGDLVRLKSNYIKMLVPHKTEKDTLLNDLIVLPKEQHIGDQMVQELMNKYPLDVDKISHYLSCLQDDGSFSDINYRDEKRTSWEPKQHAERILELCKLYASDTTPLYHDNKIIKTIHQLLHYWFVNQPKCKNWWQNEIGIPRTLGQALLIIEDQLDEQERKGTLVVMDNAHFGMTGQNKVWLSSNMMIKGLLTNDEQLVQQARDSIASEITINGKEGIRPDWSYHLHGPQQQFGNYGLAFLSSMTFFYKLFEGTSYQFSDQQRTILVNLIDNGYRWIIWHRQMDISSLGRQLFMRASTHKGYMTAFCAQELGLTGFPLQGNPLIGHKHFPFSDYTIHRSPTWMASVKMHSCRTIGTEHVNEDNIRGFYLGDGATYYYTDKDDYIDALPFWDWRKVPGTTAYDSSVPVVQKKNVGNSSAMVGGISDGLYGVSAMDYARDMLYAKKAWFFTPDAVICLGADIHSDSSLCVTTSIDQRLSREPLLLITNKKQENVTQKTIRGKARLYHHSIGYIMLQDTRLTVESCMREGQWADNMGVYKPETITGNITSMYIHHGSCPQREHYAYMVVPNTTVHSVSSFNEKDIAIVQNNDVCQMVGGSIMNNEYWGVFYKPGSIKVHKTQLTISQPGLYHFRKDGGQFVIMQSHIFK